MKHVIIGTAGHIDHGKTTLIKALTGRETDTTKEEKARGISINLGFTFFDLPSGKRAGIIDVPGHEKFIKNMLAGVSSVDVVLLVIAADEGIMPQTEEHFEILQLLNIKKGIVVLTKSDLVDDEWKEMVVGEVKEKFKNTFLESAPVIPVSSKTGQGLESLIKEIEKATEEVAAKDTEGHFRLPVDRVFSVSGFGTVVTGTVISGKIKEGETIQVYPSMVLGKIRNIQVHETNVEVAEAGQRCALNIANVKVEDIERGDVISKEKLMESSLIVDGKLYHLKSAEKPIENRQRMRLYHGTSEVLCRVVILDKEEIKPGEEAYVQFKLEKPITTQRNDRYVLRTYSPMITVAGGTIIQPVAHKAKRFDSNYIEELKIKESGELEGILEKTIEKLSSTYPTVSDILKALGKNEENIEEKLQGLLSEGKIIELTWGDKKVYIHKNFFNKSIEIMQKLLQAYHKENPLKVGISKEELKVKVYGKAIKQKNYDEILDKLQNLNIIKITNSHVSLNDFEIKYTKEQEAIKENILRAFNENPYSPPKYEEILNKEKDKKGFKMVFDSLIDNEALVKTSEEAIFLKEHYDKAKEHILEKIKVQGFITAGEARDILNTSRKYAVAILEHFDSIKLTKRQEDKRVLY